MTIISSVILGIIEGLTEFLPISSTAHLIIASEWLHLPTTDFLKTFEISIQLGAILAVVFLYWRKIWLNFNLVLKIATAFIPTAMIGLVFYKIVKNYLLDNLYIVALALLLGGVVLIIFEKYYQKKTINLNAKTDNVDNLNYPEASLESLTYKQAALIGACQSLAIIPGVSRAAATIIGGLSLGIKRIAIVEFSFLLAIPTMLAATGLDLYKSQAILNNLSQNDWLAWLIGLLISFITAIIGVKFFIKFIQKNNFIPFGWYRIGLGIIVLAWLLI